MTKLLSKIILVGILAAAVLGTPATVSAQSTNKPAAGASEGKSKSVSFHGKVASIDKSAKTITLDDKNKRTLQVTSETKIKKDDKPATLDDVTVGETVGGSYKKGEDNKMTLNTLYIGGKSKKK
jgi:protein-disulfide isomerase